MFYIQPKKSLIRAYYKPNEYLLGERSTDLLSGDYIIMGKYSDDIEFNYFDLQAIEYGSDNSMNIDSLDYSIPFQLQAAEQKAVRDSGASGFGSGA